MEKFLAYCYIVAILALVYWLFIVFCILETKKHACDVRWADGACMDLK